MLKTVLISELSSSPDNDSEENIEILIQSGTEKVFKVDLNLFSYQFQKSWIKDIDGESIKEEIKTIYDDEEANVYWIYNLHKSIPDFNFIRNGIYICNDDSESISLSADAGKSIKFSTTKENISNLFDSTPIIGVDDWWTPNCFLSDGSTNSYVFKNATALKSFTGHVENLKNANYMFSRQWYY